MKSQLVNANVKAHAERQLYNAWRKVMQIGHSMSSGNKKPYFIRSFRLYNSSNFFPSTFHISSKKKKKVKLTYFTYVVKLFLFLNYFVNLYLWCYFFTLYFSESITMVKIMHWTKWNIWDTFLYYSPLY